MNYTLEPTVTKELILSKVREETLMEHYLGIPVKKGLFKSPLRVDSHPTCAFYRNKKGTIIFKDFRGDFSGDCVSVVMYKFGCSFYKALQIIANDFGIISRKDLTINPSKIKKYSETKFEDKGNAIIQVELKDWNRFELDWWQLFGISQETLKKFRVYSCKNVFLNGEIFHLYKEKQLVFGYFGGIKDDIEQWRIYYPGNRKYKFISNWKQIQLQGAKQLPRNGGEYLVITKSLKDVMTIYECSNLPAIAPISENCFITDSQYQRLKAKFKKIVLFYDSDIAGISSMNKIRKKYPDLFIIFIPRKYHCKDISDFYKKYGLDKTINLINIAKQYIDEEDSIRRNKTKEETI